jgi:hypothetical protein
VLAGGGDGYLISRGAWSWPVLGAAVRRSVAAVRRSVAAVRRSVAAVRRSVAAVRRSVAAVVRRSVAAVVRRSVAAVRRSVAAVVRRSVAAVVRRFVTAVRRSVAAERLRNHTVWILSARGDENSDKCATDKQQEPIHWIRPRSHRCSTSKSLIGLSERYEIETDLYRQINP